ncbi:recQ-mediated genome instability protein 2-like [Sphaeramia orbicularis]|uniref:RecQ-mediated genome instability protein 2-like n=1 Tax=Sphaeramia orbicularis TaxID=375764 RepID=A0A672YBS0_9TELE|nr:recQ-mediated genome instability protein 2-like [Sphaeramia orbicularis]
MSKTEQSGPDRKRPPPVKVLSGQLRTGSDCGDGVLIKAGPGRSLPVSLVWMQGTVMEVQPDQNTVVLMDETGTFTVQGVKNIPKGKPCLSPGKYVMVMGVVQAVSPEPVVRAVKLADLSELAALHRRMWKLEVEDLQQVLA